VEQMPYPSLLKFLEPYALKLGGSFGSLGTQKTPTVLYNSAGIGSATVICYESVYGEHCAKFVKQGAQFIAIITNDGWWGNTDGHKQHALYAKLRAIENRRSIARSANTGISSFIDQRGDVIQASKWWEATSLEASINLNENITYYTDHGDYLAHWMIAVFIFMLLHLVYFKFFAKK
jgi:apolipoprotein N-acyltransferase